MKKIIIAGLFLILLGGCQFDSSNKRNSHTETSSSKMRISSETTESKAASAQQPKEEEAITYNPGSLLQAVSTNNLEKAIDILQSSSYPIDEVNDKKETPLMIAVHNNQVEIAKKLIDAGANINYQDTIQDSPYLYAGAEGRTEILAYMLTNSSPDQAIANRFGGNALIPAAEKGHLENVKILLNDRRVNINHQNNYGYTALIEAVALRDGSQVYQDIVAELLKHGADPNIADNYGKTAKDYANEFGYGNISKLLQENS